VSPADVAHLLSLIIDLERRVEKLEREVSVINEYLAQGTEAAVAYTGSEDDDANK
jgi:hypothetical protein